MTQTFTEALQKDKFAVDKTISLPDGLSLSDPKLLSELFCLYQQ